jgi:amino acid adenylation domain-containing protein
VTVADGFWREHLRGAPPESRIPGSTVAVHDDLDFRSRLPFVVSPQTLGKARELSESTGAELFSFMVAVTQLLVARLSAQDDVVIATSMTSTVPLRAMFTKSTTFRQHLADVQQLVRQAREHQHSASDASSQVMLNFSDAATESATRCDFSWRVGTTDGDGLSGWLEFRAARYPSEWARAIGKRLSLLIESVLADPDLPVHQLEFLPDEERAKLFALAAEPGEDPGPMRLTDFVLDQARRRPDAVAVRGEDGELTYRELIKRARLLADELRSHTVGPDVIVGVCAQRSVRLVVALLAVLLAGGAYLPLDVAHPRRRIAAILEEAAPRVLLADDDQVEKLRLSGADAVVLPLGGTGVAGAGEPHGGVPSELDLAYVIYTSGSTGRPKGVAVAHRGIVNRIMWMQERYRLCADDVVLQKTPYMFDVSVWEFFWPLMYGATLVVAAPNGHKEPGYLTEVIRREAVTTVHFVPSMLALFVEEPTLRHCSSLRRVICSGEALPSKLIARFRSENPAEVHNLYGPTEASIDVTHWTCGADLGPVVPIGRPIANTTVYVLDRFGELAPIGTPGELHLGGVGLARGYLGQPALTAERFVPDPFAGTVDGRLYRTGDLARWHPGGYLEFLGRMDHQVKLRGLRIELGEIAAALLEHPSVTEAVALLRDDMGPNPKLVAYVVADPPALCEELRNHLAELLPEYMIPTRIVHLLTMPLTSNGKLDRQALPRPQTGRRRL